MVAAASVGFCVAAEKLFGPLQVYVALAIVFALSDKVCPAQTGVLLPGVGAAGGGETVTDTVPADPVQPAVVAVTE